MLSKQSKPIDPHMLCGFVVRTALLLTLSVAIRSEVRAQVAFEDVSSRTKIASQTAHRTSVASGWVDINNDGFLDLYIGRGDDGAGALNELFLNRKDGTFTKLQPFVNASPNYTGQFCWGDYDNDGYVDLYENQFMEQNGILWKNNGDNTFSSVPTAIQAGRYSTGCVWTDIDNDGRVDLILNTQAGNGSMVYLNGTSGFRRDNSIFHNEGVGDEIEVADINDDGSPDYLFGNAHGQDSIFISAAPGVYRAMDNTFLASRRVLSDYPGSAAFGDIDNDGFPDLFVHYPDKLFLFKNQRGAGFTDTTGAVGLTAKGNAAPKGVYLVDVDNDGHKDIIVYNSLATSEIWYGSDTGFVKNDAPFSYGDIGNNLCWADYDNDGFVDFLQTGQNGTTLWRNVGNNNRWLTVNLRGRKSNSSGIGAKVTSYFQGQIIKDEIGYNQGYYGYRPLQAHFGYGTDPCGSFAQNIDSIVIDWPSGIRQSLAKVEYNQIIFVDENLGIVQQLKGPNPPDLHYGFVAVTSYQRTSIQTAREIKIPAKVFVPSSLKLDTMSISEIDYSVRFDPAVLSIDAAKFATEILPAPGFRLKQATVLNGLLSITIENPQGLKQTNEVDLGTISFKVIGQTGTRAIVELGSFEFSTPFAHYAFCSSLEGNFFARVDVVAAGVRDLAGGSDEWIDVKDGLVSVRSVRETDRVLSITIYDLLGRSVVERSVMGPSPVVDISALPAGVYTAVARYEHHEIHAKILK